MRFGDLLDATTITLDIEATRKEEAIEAVVRTVCTARNLESGVVLREVMEREQSLSTGVGQGVAVPHAIIEGLAAPVVGIGRHPLGVEFDSIDGQPVHLLVLLLSPNGDIPQHLKLLSRVSRLFQQGGLRTAIQEAHSGEEVLRVLREAETHYTDL